jgi:hypothetical protein
LDVGADPKNIQAIQKFLYERENTIHILKQKLKILGAEHVQTSELITGTRKGFSATRNNKLKRKGFNTRK